jgi:hypothetical protein
VRCHDTDRSGALQYNEFEALYIEIMQWKAIFEAEVVPGTSWITFDGMARVWARLNLGLSDDVRRLALESMIPDDGVDRIQFVDFIRLLAELKSLVKFIAENHTAAGTIHLTADNLAASFFLCRG